MSQQQSPLPLALQHHLHHQQQMHQAALQHQHHAALQHQQQHQLQQQPHGIWHARSYESGIGVYKKLTKMLYNQYHQQPKPRPLHQPRK